MNVVCNPNSLRLSPVWAPPPPGVIFPPRFPPGGPSFPPPLPLGASSVRQPPTSIRGSTPSSADHPFVPTPPGVTGAHTPTWRCHLSLSMFTWAMRYLGDSWSSSFFEGSVLIRIMCLMKSEKPTSFLHFARLIYTSMFLVFYFFFKLLFLL